MNRVNIYEAKARLSELIEAVEAGGRVIICRRNQPVVEIVRAAAPRTVARPVGTARGLLRVPKSFFDNLPEELVLSFNPRPDPDSKSEALPGAPRAGARQRLQPAPKKGRRS
ncbi:MAG: type II toxin-antitoxin system Phd/YefM family antitoxin [Vicinamibacterales bacterium]